MIRDTEKERMSPHGLSTHLSELELIISWEVLCDVKG